MAFEFLFWLFLSGIVIASLQDLKRREVDDWLNLFLLFSGIIYILFSAFFEKRIDLIFQAGFVLLIGFGLMQVFYYGRVFAGGDAKLLFAISIFFIGANFWQSLLNIGLFVILLMLAGAVYGLFCFFVLYFKNFKKMNEQFREYFALKQFRLAVFGALLFSIFGFLSQIFLIVGLFLLFLTFLYVFALAVEKAAMIREVSGKDLREGDWLVSDVRVGRKIIRARWDGLSKEDLKIMRNLKKVRIKDGLPFVPAFLIAFLLFFFFKNLIFSILFKGFLV